MLKPIAAPAVVALFLVLTATAVQAEATLTALETQWLDAAEPVLAYADEQGLPLDIVVQPETKKGDVPLAMGYDGGRCKLVFTFRGNQKADEILAGVAPAQVSAVIQAVIAHEVGHCWRHTRGTWRTPPAGFVADADRRHRDMQQTRGEEGFADLVALAWTSSRNPDQYTKVHAWLQQVRNHDVPPGSHHDTRVWIRLAQDRAAFKKTGTPFEQATAVWVAGRDNAG
jgi:hypothetical protein